MPGVLYAFEGMLYQLDTRPDGKFYCQIYHARIRAAVATTSDYDKEEDAVIAAKALIRDYQASTG
jgi:hypothetical protein